MDPDTFQSKYDEFCKFQRRVRLMYSSVLLIYMPLGNSNSKFTWGFQAFKFTLVCLDEWGLELLFEAVIRCAGVDTSESFVLIQRKAYDCLCENYRG